MNPPPSMMKRLFHLRLLASLCALSASAQVPQFAKIEQVSGRVILDANANGKIDPGEMGLAGVAVTDGVNIVLSGEDGSYQLKIADDPVIPFKPAQVVSITWPSDTWPTSQWWQRAADMRPGQAVDFCVQRKAEQKLPFKIVHATDPHDNFAPGERSPFRNDIEQMRGDLAFSIITGDLGYAGVLSAHTMFASVRRFTRNFPIPMFHTVGNHDVVGIHSQTWNKQTEVHGNGAFTKYLGPVRWSFNHAGIHIVGLDWALVDDDGSIQTGIPRVALDWLEKDLALIAPGSRVLVFIHSQYSPDAKFYQLVAKHEIELVMAGHSHRNLDLSIPGTRILTTMNLRGPYRLVQVNGDGLAFINRCTGCKDPKYHSKHCALARAFKNPLSAGSGTSATLKDLKLTGGPIQIGKPAAGPLEVMVSIDPGTSQRCGLKIGPLVDGRSLEIAFADNAISAAGVRTAVVRRPDQKNFDLHVYIEDGLAKIFANGRVQFDVPCKTKGAVSIAAFADKGTAKLMAADLWQRGAQ